MRSDRARSSRIEAAEWVASFREGPGTDQERRRFVDWLQESPRHVSEYLEIASLWHDIGAIAGETDVGALLAGVDAAVIDATVTPLRAGEAVPMRSVGSAPGRLRRRPLLAIAATGLVAVGLVAWLAPPKSEPVEYSTDVGEQRSLPLEDGSLVSLNTQSRIRVVLGDSARRIDLLKGEALFDVAPDSDRPFIVSAGGTEIRAVGTSFNVYRRSEGVAVTVLEGRVALRSVVPRTVAVPTVSGGGAGGPDYGYGSTAVAAPDPSAPQRIAAAGDAVAARIIELGIGEQAYVTPASSEVTAAPADVERVMAWTERRLIFENDTLADVIREFNRYNVAKLEVLDRSLADLRLSGVFEAHDPDSMIEFLQRTRSVRVVQVGDRRVLVP